MEESILSLAEKDEPPSLLATVNQTATSQNNNFPSLQTKNAKSFLSKKPNLNPNNSTTSNVFLLGTDTVFKENSEDFTLSDKTVQFINKFYPNTTIEQWNSWHWQVKNRIRTIGNLEKILSVSDDEREAIQAHQGPLPFAITPYYASLLDSQNSLQPIRRTVITVKDEQFLTAGEEIDPLNEDGDSPIPGLVHRYPDRVLFLVTGFCSVYCRYCTRSRMVGTSGGEHHFNMQNWERAIEYIRQHEEVRDVLLSGGDPLTLEDSKLEWLLSHLREIPHVEFIRIGTKVPVVLPQRITPNLVNMLKKYHPVWISIHFAHPEELTPETSQACQRLADNGIPLGSQTVLLKGINDNVETMTKLNQGLLKIRVKPYYLYQCDPVAGTSHFRTSVSKGLEIIEGLRGHTTGYAVPQYVIDAPGGGGKIPILPEYVVGHDGDSIILRNFEMKTFKYPDPIPNLEK